MKIPKQINLKTALIFVGISILLTSGLFYVFAATPSSTFYISSEIYPGAPSYTIWVEGSNYFAKDDNGHIDYSGTNASEVIQHTIDALVMPSVERTIRFREGVYLLDVGLSVSEYYVQFFGCGRKTVFRANADMDALLSLDETNSLLHLEDLCLDGYNKATTTLDLSRSSSLSKRVTIINTWIFGGKTVDINVTNREEVSISTSYIGSEDYTTDYPFYCGGATGFVSLSDTTVYGGTVASVYYTGVRFRAVLCQFGAHVDYGNAYMIELHNYTSLPYITLTNCHFEQRNASHVAVYSVAPTGSSRPSLYVSETVFVNPIQGNYTEIAIASTAISISGSFTYGIECDYCGILYGNARIYANTSIASGVWNLYNLYYKETQSGSA